MLGAWREVIADGVPWGKESGRAVARGPHLRIEIWGTRICDWRRLVGSGGAFAGFYFFEEPDNSYAEKTKEREPAEDVDEGPVGGLTL